MRKEDFASDVVYLIMIAIAVVLGLTVLQDLVGMFGTDVPFGNTFLFSIVVVLLAIIFNALIIELGHLIGANLGGYKVTFFNVLWFCFLKKDSKWKFKFSEFDGLTGETKIVPDKEKRNPKLYVWFPVILYAVELIAVIIIFNILLNGTDKDGVALSSKFTWLLVSSFIFVCVGGLIILYDYVPLRLDSMTDGYRLTLLNSKVNCEAFDKMLEIEDKTLNGIDVGEIPTYDEITDFTALINLNKVYQFLDNKDYASALELLNKTIANPKKISSSTQGKCISNILFIKLMNEDGEKAKEYYNSVESWVRKFIYSDTSADACRAYMLVCGIIEESKSEVNFAISRMPKALKFVPKNRQEKEQALFEEALSKIKVTKPQLFEIKNDKEKGE